MKKTLILMACATLMYSASYSQQADRTSFGIRAGVNFQNLNGENNNGDKLENKMIPGFNVGVNAEILVAPEFYLQPGVLFTTKGAKDENNADFKTKISYLEIPVNFLYKPVLGSGRLLLGVGPYAAFGLGGKMEAGEAETDIEWENEITPQQALTGAYLKRFDAGANLLVGYELNSRLSAQLNAQLGMINIKPDISGVDEDSKTKNTGFGISLGYRF